MIFTEQNIRKCVHNLVMGIYDGNRYRIQISYNESSTANADQGTVYIHDNENDVDINLAFLTDVNMDTLQRTFSVAMSSDKTRNHYIYFKQGDSKFRRMTVNDPVLYNILQGWALQRMKDDITKLDQKVIDAFKLSE